MKFVILVAGVGSRLRPLTNHKPKCLVEVGGQSILGRLLKQAEETGWFEEALLLTGYRQDAVEQFAREWNGNHAQSLPVRTIHNERFDETNNGYSLWCARGELSGGFVLSDGDLVLDAAILKRVADPSDRSGSVLAVDMQSKLDEEAMKFVRDSNGSVVALSKEISVQEGEGESIGLCRISADDAGPIVSYLDQLVKEGLVNEYYERAFQEYLSDGWKPGVIDIGSYAWVEIDDHSDLNRAEKKFGMTD